MKKYFLTLALMLPMVAMAQSWTAPAASGPGSPYPDRTPVYVQVNVNGQVTTSGLKLAAFIGDECRGEVSSPTADATGAATIYTVEALGNADTDASKTITFRAYFENVEYSFTAATAVFSADNSAYNMPSNPLVLNLDAVTGVSLPETINISRLESEFPCTMDLSSQITLTYSVITAPAYTPFTPLGESKIESTITYNWDVGNYVSELSFDGNSLTVNTARENNYDIQLNVTIGEKDPMSASTVIAVQIAKVPVETVSCSITSTDFYAWDDFATFMQDKVTITPDNASDKTFYLDGGDYLRDGVFTKGGQYTVRIVPYDDTYEGTIPTVTVTVYERPTNIASQEPNGLTVYVNDNVYETIASTTIFSWMGTTPEDAYAKKDLTYTVGSTGYISDAGVATKAGQVRVTVTLTNGITASAEAQGSDNYTIPVNIISRLDVQLQQGEQRSYVKGVISKDSPALVYVTNPGNEPFDMNDLTIVFDDRYEGFPYAEQNQVLKVGTSETSGADIYGFYILPKFVSQSAGYVVMYQGAPIGDNDNIIITQEQELAEGWNWIAVNSMTSRAGDAVTSVFTQADIVEMRSQKALLYNDPQLGYFGDLSSIMASDAMYKVKTNKATTAVWGAISAFDVKQTSAEILAGYNWMNNPYEFDLPFSRISEFLGENFTPTEGDRIISQGGFAMYTGGTWTPSDGFALQAGSGLIYLSNAETVESSYIDFDPTLAPQAETAPVKGFRDMEDNMGADLFQYNPHAFADNMSMVAVIDGLENPENYTLGVFVNGECRGRGRVAVDDKMFVSAVGKVGEQMTFKLANNQTGEVTDLDETMTYSLIKGSLKAPVVINGSNVTGIAKTMNDAQDDVIYDMSGRRVEKMQKGIYIVGGKKVLKK